jgi:hypothetical protein
LNGGLVCAFHYKNTSLPLQQNGYEKDTRFNETYNYPFWATDSIASMFVKPPMSSWKIPAKSTNPAVVKMMQPHGVSEINTV